MGCYGQATLGYKHFQVRNDAKFYSCVYKLPTINLLSYINSRNILTNLAPHSSLNLPLYEQCYKGLLRCNSMHSFRFQQYAGAHQPGFIDLPIDLNLPNQRGYSQHSVQCITAHGGARTRICRNQVGPLKTVYFNQSFSIT